MAAPTLIIGLGGVGSRIIAKVEALATPKQKESLSFVAFDTDVNDLRALKEKGYNGYFVQTSSKLTVGEYLELDQQSRDSWFPVNNILCRKAVSEGAGQVRAISRLAFTSSIREGRMNELHEAIDSLYKLSGETTVQALRVIIVSTLAGGTGSGILLPVALYLRDYLSTNYQLSASISRGFFILPEVLYKVIPTESERNNLRCNAYATLREIDAFLMKGDGRLPEPYKSNLKLELPAIGSKGLRNMDVMPFDFCFLFDGQNMDGGTLNTYDDYIAHAANCIFAQSIGPTSAKSNSSEDNVVLSLVAEAGRNRYCGAGSAVLEYPYEDVRDFIAFNWAKEKMGKEWLAADFAYKEKKKEAKQNATKGMVIKNIDRGDEYITYIENTKDDSFVTMVKNSCSVLDQTGLNIESNKWEDYAEELERYCDEHSIHRNATLEDKATNIIARIDDEGADEDKTKEKFDEVTTRDILHEIKGYTMTVNAVYENAVRSIAHSLFKSTRDKMQDAEAGKEYLEKALKAADGSALHPNAIRFYLYNLKNTLEGKIDFYEREKKDRQEEWESASSSLLEEFNDEKKKKVVFKRKKKERATQKQGDFLKYLQSVDGDEGYRIYFIRHEIFMAALIYVTSLIEKYEIFYDNLEKNLEALDYRMTELKQKYEIDCGKAIRYVCANKKCLEYFNSRLVSPAGLLDLPKGFSSDIYSAIRKAMLDAENIDGPPAEHKEWHKNIFYNIILAFWRKMVENNCSTFIDLDVISAIKMEAEILESEDRKVSDVDYRETYLIDRATEARKLAMPFISVERGIQQHVNETCTYNEELTSEFRVENKDKVLPNGIPVKDDQLNKYKLLYYKAIYGKRANQIPKFAPQKISKTAPKDQGEYFRAYFERIQCIDPNAGCSKVITPHIDKKWHIISELPDLDEKNQQKQQKDIFKAMLYAFLYEYIQFEEFGTSKRYVYKNEMDAFSGNDEALGGSRTTEFIVSNNTPCDQFYEVLEALTINPIIVNDILRRVEKMYKKETENRKSLENSEFNRALENLRIKSVIFDTPRSLFEMPILYKVSSPVDEYNAETADLLSMAAMKFIRDNILWYIEDSKVDKYLVDVIWKQYTILEANLKEYEKSEDETYHGFVKDTLSNNVRTVVKKFFYEQGDSEKVAFIKANMEN